MGDLILPDDIIYNIIVRLPAKTLLRFMCVSKYWNHVIREPDFMKLRSRKSIFLFYDSNFHLIDDTCNSIVKQPCYPIHTRRETLKIIGTFNGVVLFAVLNKLILYNPFTCVSKELPDPPSFYDRDAYGFGYGDDNDLKIVRFRQHYIGCDVYNLRENSWSSWSTYIYNHLITFRYDVGHFVNGFLYWIVYFGKTLVAVDVKDIELSEICLPFEIRKELDVNRLGTVNGCLCILESVTSNRFDMWVMKEHNQRSNIYSFDLPLNLQIHSCGICCLLESRRILMWNPDSKGCHNL